MWEFCEYKVKSTLWTIVTVCALIVIVAEECDGQALLNLGAEEIVQAGQPPADIVVCGYSVPSYVDWNNDGKNDLIVGEGSGICGYGKVRVYLNVGTQSNPQFSDYFYAQSNGFDLTVSASGCLGCFPRVVYWDEDARKDLLVGLANGTVKIFLNINTDSDPSFDGGATVQVGIPDFSQENLDVGYRATPMAVDWDADTHLDLVVGALDGKIHIYINCGCGGWVPPSFWYSPPEGEFAQENGSDLIVPSARSSPVVVDLDGDGKKDLLTGNTNGELLFYSNTGTAADPNFSGYLLVKSAGIPIDLPGTPRSRPFVCDWTGDGYLDVLIGAGDGKVHLFQGVPIGDLDYDGYVDMLDFATFAIYWLDTDCGACGGADLTFDGNVDFNDLRELVANWLVGSE